MTNKIFSSPTDSNYYFGYYDKSPLDSSASRLLAMRTSFLDRLPAEGDIAEIGYFDLASEKFNSITFTNSFNWQQGAMLQWLGPSFDTRVAFNRRIDNRFCSVIHDLETGNERILSLPIYTVNRKGEFALTIDFERHYWCRRGYSYDGVVVPEKNQPVVPGDGIWCLDIKSDKAQRIVAIEDLLKIQPLASMHGATHYVEHMMFAPDDRTFAFYHRWKLAEGGIYARLYVSDIDGGKPRLVHDTGRLSHYCWIDDHTILAGGAEKASVAGLLRKYKFLTKLIKPLMPLYRSLVKGNATDGQTRASSILTGDSYFIVDINSRKTKPVFRQAIDRDGHPSGIPGRPNWIVTDTYPDTNSRAKLLLGNLNTEEIITLGELNSIPEFDNTPSRCDLHPKISHDGRFVSIDTMNDGVRSIYLYGLPELPC